MGAQTLSSGECNNPLIERLLKEARGGSSVALGELLQSHRRYLLWLASHELRDDVRAKAGPSDIVQQTLMRAQEGFDRFRGHSPEQLQGWLRAILLNNLANFHRDFLATEKRNVAQEASLEAGSASLPGLMALADTGKSPSSLLRHDEESNRLRQAIDNLPEDYRQVITLRYWRRMTFGDIGQQMQRTAEAARKLWGRAVGQLEQQLGSLGDDRR